jgi:hypothetical protein
VIVKWYKYAPKAFTEKGLYMLATILKSPIAAQTTIAIVETFAKMRELSRVISKLPEVQEKEQQKALRQCAIIIFATLTGMFLYMLIKNANM